MERLQNLLIEAGLPDGGVQPWERSIFELLLPFFDYLAVQGALQISLLRHRLEWRREKVDLERQMDNNQECQ